jgi:hypothetical protein
VTLASFSAARRSSTSRQNPAFWQNQPTMPGEDGVGSDDCGDLAQGFSPEQLSFRGKATALDIAQTEPPSPELLPKNAILFLEVVNDVLLVLIYPASERCQQDMPRAQVVEHPAILQSDE